MNSASIFKVRRGGIDLRGYEVVRVQFFSFASARSLTLSSRGLRFSAACIRELGGSEYAEVLVQSSKKSLVVKPCSQNNKRVMRWASFKNGRGCGCTISGAAFIEPLYELFGLSPACKYRFRGSVRYVDGEAVIDFDLSEPEAITPEGLIYPDSWGSSFGRDYYLHKAFRSTSQYDDGPVTQSLYSTEPDIHPTPTETLRAEISALLEMMQSSEADNGTESGASL